VGVGETLGVSLVHLGSTTRGLILGSTRAGFFMGESWGHGHVSLGPVPPIKDGNPRFTTLGLVHRLSVLWPEKGWVLIPLVPKEERGLLTLFQRCSSRDIPLRPVGFREIPLRLVGLREIPLRPVMELRLDFNGSRA